MAKLMVRFEDDVAALLRQSAALNLRTIQAEANRLVRDALLPGDKTKAIREMARTKGAK